MEFPDPTPRQKLAAALVASVVVGIEVVRTTREMAIYVCPVAVPADAHQITKVRIDHLHVDWAGCGAIIPLAPTYLGLVALFGLAFWVRR